VFGSGTFQPWSVADLDEDGSPHWDRPSNDAPNANIGYQLIGSGMLSDAPGSISFYGEPFESGRDAGGEETVDFYFESAGSKLAFELNLEVSAFSDINAVGWYDVDRPGDMNLLIEGSADSGHSIVFQPSAAFGLYLVSGDGQTYFTESSLNPIREQSHQHFSLFSESEQPGHEIYWLGVEDLSVSQLNQNEGGRGDYNDLVIRLQTIPEPSTWALVLLSLIVTQRSLSRRSS